MFETLKDTVRFMNSNNYKKRFIAEYWQLRIRYIKLYSMVAKWDKLTFVPICDKSTYLFQLQKMFEYMEVLEERAREEDIDLYDTRRNIK